MGTRRNAAKLYFAAPLFNEMEREYNARLTERLERKFAVFLPQRDGNLMVDLIRDGMSAPEAKMTVFGKDVAAIAGCDVLLIVLNGRSVDEGTAFELGVAFSLGKVCWGLKTDIRQLLPMGDNPMIEGALNRVFHSTEELLKHVSAELPLVARPMLEPHPEKSGSGATATNRGRRN
jgi:nucleoside 2-deoxyribosyltransferase